MFEIPIYDDIIEGQERIQDFLMGGGGGSNLLRGVRFVNFT